MYDTMPVQICNCLAHLPEVYCALLFTKSTLNEMIGYLLPELPEKIAVECILQHEIHILVVTEEAVHSEQIGMAQESLDLNFLGKLSDHVIVEDNSLADGLQRNYCMSNLIPT